MVKTEKDILAISLDPLLTLFFLLFVQDHYAFLVHNGKAGFLESLEHSIKICLYV